MKKIFISLVLVMSSTLSFSQDKGLDKQIDEAFAPISDFFSNVVFFQVGGYPFVILLVGWKCNVLYYLFWFSKYQIFFNCY